MYRMLAQDDSWRLCSSCFEPSTDTEFVITLLVLVVCVFLFFVNPNDPNGGGNP